MSNCLAANQNTASVDDEYLILVEFDFPLDFSFPLLRFLLCRLFIKVVFLNFHISI